MSICKKILHLLSIFALFFPLPLFSQKYAESDFNRLILNHPMMKNFDPSSGRFRNTPSEIISVGRLKQDIAAIQARMDSLNEDKKAKLTVIFEALKLNVSEENAWKQINDFDHSISELKEQLTKKNELLADLGVPGYETVLSVTRKIFLDTRKSIPQGDKIVLNSLPRFPLPHKPDFGKISLRTFFLKCDAEKLKAYLQNKIFIGMLFSKVYQPILFNDQEEKQE